jgi:Xaa-Pro aminopeptidase
VKSDLDRLMSERNYDALLVIGSSNANPPLCYLTGGVSLGEATLVIKKRGEAPVIFANSMEREEAAKAGLRVIDQNQFDRLGLIRAEGGSRLRGAARLVGKAFAELGVRGNVLVWGHQDTGEARALFEAIEELNPSLHLHGEYENTLFDAVTATKDAAEVKRIKAVGRKTVQTVAAVEEFLTAHRARHGYLVKKDGARLTIGDVKRHINRLLMDAGVVDVGWETIFAIGHDAGVPHSRGADRDPLALGKSLIFDIFPAEPGGGYFFDFTRTWCLGYAPEHVQRAYDDVLATYQSLLKSLKPGELFKVYQRMTCDLLEARGHPTVQSDPKTTRGYVHGLGHGVGLRIHESPGSYDFEGNTDRLDPGVVITLEPGLYYPDHPKGGFGVRVEDTLWLNPATSKFEILAKYPYDLVLKVKK